jgi:hypothetical protein
LTTCLPDQPGRRKGGTIFFKPELNALILGAEAERAWTKDLISWCWKKREQADFTLDFDTALAGLKPEPDQGWTVGRLLHWFKADLVAVELPVTGSEQDRGFPAAA